MSTHSHDREEQRLGALLNLVARDAPAPNQAFLNRLRAESAAVFAAHSTAPLPLPQFDMAEEASAPEVSPAAEAFPRTPARRSRMLVFAYRIAVAGVTAAAVAAFWLWSLFAPSDSGVAFGKVLDQLAGAKALRLDVTRSGQTTQIWTRGDRLRRNFADGTYEIARGSRAWLVDEKANRAAVRSAAYFRAEQGGLDVVTLLGLPAGVDRTVLVSAKPAERRQSGGVTCDCYHWELTIPNGRLQVDAEVDAGTQQLRSLETKEDRDGQWSPLAAVTVLAVDKPVPEELFIVGETLTEDGRIGKVTDVQGIVSLKPVLATRWTPVSESLLLQPGDWLRTDNRGANAVTCRLIKDTRVTLGPGSLVELQLPTRLRIHSGEVQVVPGEKQGIEVLGPDQQQRTIREAQIFRVSGGQLQQLEQEPLWLKSFQGRVVNESLGSLVAKVDGRDVPLTVGYHKVNVDIRDQIARTEIEESFVNHTTGRLEGVFYFPLPTDASISGFGMWIGNELVEADVVEKQRAREIYEEILRERRDPGLLEWSGGNLFKARVFPIEAQSEKRIKITYTQVLPLHGARYRYSYALQSEMLKQHPLRELAIDVKLNSVRALTNVSSPTHSVRLEQTPHSAHVEFTAQEYTPARDFEVVVETAGRQADVALIPHRRGDDGYFMLLVTPPAPSGDWQRDLLPESEPLEVLILADTSASLDTAARTTQAQFVAGLLNSLSPKDTFNLAGCDVECDWAFEKSVAADAKSVEAARKFLASRLPLGWTDLDKALASALKKCGPKTRLIYIGDGVPTTGDADAVACSKRLRQLYLDATTSTARPGTSAGEAAGAGPTCYAVSVGSSFEAVVLKTIASLGGGSVRQITGEHGPQAVARELLAELARPGLRDLRVEFKGLRTARVYPEELPSLPVGAQQILLGRYLPEGRDQTGEVIVTGTQAGKAVRLHAAVTLQDAEQGNSFIPRLWARQHLEALLQQGTAQAIQDEIIALSEQYHIMTPYTSLLVLESDADRERFKVKRRFQMRDGEKFFAAGRENADYELVQQQMKRAGSWRLGLRRSVLQQLATLGRNPGVFQQSGRPPYVGAPLSSSRSFYSYGRRGGFGGGGWSEQYQDIGGMGGGMGGLALDHSYANGPMAGPVGSTSYTLGDLGAVDAEDSYSPDVASKWERTESDESRDKSNQDAQPDAPAEPATEVGLEVARDSQPKDMLSAISDGFERDSKSSYGYWDGDLFESNGRLAGEKRKEIGGLAFAANSEIAAGYLGRYDGDYWTSYQYRQWLETLFPQVPSPPAPDQPQTLKPAWPVEARAIAQSLLRRQQLAGLAGGLELEQQSEIFEARSGDLTQRSLTLGLLSPQSWLVRTQTVGSQTTVQWCDGQQRGIYSRAFQLGRQRTAMPLDRDPRAWPVDLSGYLLTPLNQAFGTYSVELKPQLNQQALLILKAPKSVEAEIQILVDTARHVVLAIEHRNAGKLTSATKFEEFVEAAGVWWPARIATRDEKGRQTSVVTQKFAVQTADAFSRRLQQELAGREQVQFLREPSPLVRAAKQTLAAGKASFDEQFTLLMHFVRSQQWARAMTHLEQAEKLAAGKPGMRWVRSAFLNISRRREELRTRLMQETGTLVQLQSGEELHLADYLVSQSSGILEAHEMLALSDALRPLYERQPAHVLAQKRWQANRVSYLQQTGQSEPALELQKRLAEQYPRDYSLQQQYAQALANLGNYEDAYRWLTQTLGRDVEWATYEEESLRSAYAQLLQTQGRYENLAEYLAAWTKRNPDGTGAYQQYLSALVRLDRLAEAEQLLTQWLKEGQQPGTLPPPVASRLSAAVHHALGQGYNLYTNRLEERWLKPLGETAQFLVRHPNQAHVAEQIMGHWQFAQTDECRRVRRAALELLQAESANLKAEELQRLVNWVMPNDPAVELDTWRKVAEVLRRRWAAEADPDVKQRLAAPLIQILSSRLPAEDWLAFLRLQLQQAPEQYHEQCVQQLFAAVLGQPWSAKGQDEALALIGQMGALAKAEQPQGEPAAAAQAEHRLFVRVAALHQLTDRLVEARYQDLLKAVEHPEKLTRTELLAKQAENRRQAQIALADRLAQELAQNKALGALAPWVNMERIYLETKLGRQLQRVAEECWELLGPQPPAAAAAAEAEAVLPELLRNRCLLTLVHLAARKGTEPAAIERLLQYLDRAAAAADAEDSRWKLLKYELLIALDRPQDLEAALTGWLKAQDPDNRWRLALGYLLAEQGKLKEAIAHFEAIERADELDPAAYRALAGWYQVVDQRERHERAQISAYKLLGEQNLYRLLSSKLRPWQRGEGHVPHELDKEVLVVFNALFEKAGQPQNYLWQLREFYVASRDFRLPAGLADAVVGHSAGQVYPFLQQLHSVLGEVRDEATADAIVERITAVRARAKTEVDQRALDLLEVLVERRAAELLNQPGPHVEKALAALQRAFQRKWTPGEPRLLADFLGALGAISQTRLADEQVRQLRELYKLPTVASEERLHIAWRLADAVWTYDRRQEAVDLLQTNLAEHERARAGVLPVQANDVLDRYLYYLEELRHFARGEQVVFEQLKHPANPQQKQWLTRRVYQLYERALRNDGEVSLGTKEKLYQAVTQRIQTDLAERDPNHRSHLVRQVCEIYRLAHEDKKFPTAVGDIRAFAFRKVPELLQGQSQEYQALVSPIAETLARVAGARDGLAFLIERIEQEPSWLRLNNQDGWQQFSWRLGEWSRAVKDLGDLEPRLLKIVLAELRRDLETRQSRSRVMYCRRYGGYFWEAKTEEFAKTAETVLAERKTSGAAVAYIADYFYRSLERHDRGLEILLVAHRGKLLDESAQSQLVQWLQERNRHGESIAILQPLIELRPDNIQYRVWLMQAYFRTHQPQQLLGLREQTDQYFHQGPRWTESVLAALAQGCLDTELYEQAVKYYQELIPWHQRTQPRRGIGQGTLSGYYRSLALAQAGLRKTAEAVEAACGAIISWGPRKAERAQALETLRQVLRVAPDLEAYGAQLDRQSAESGQDNPLVRKALGQVLKEKGQFAKAVAQLRLAVAVEPNDAETHRELVECCDKQGDREAVIRQLLESVQLSRRDIRLYQDLGRRLTELKRPQEGERAFTSIVEVLPTESESHTLLAEIRQAQDRWSEAAGHWRQVARIRALEPTGLLQLAAVLVHEKQWAEAAETLRQLKSRAWPNRFSDVPQRVSELERQLPRDK